MKNSWIAAFALVAGQWGAGPVVADVVINGTFYEETGTVSCANSGPAGICRLTLTPPTSRVLFTKLNCIFSELPSMLYHWSFSVRDPSASFGRRYEYLPFGPPVTATTGSRFYSMTASPDFLFAAGKIPVIEGGIEGAMGNSVLQCKLTGRIQP